MYRITPIILNKKGYQINDNLYL